MERGIFVSTAAGNKGSQYRSLINGIPWVLTVAAVTMAHQFGEVVKLGNGVSLTGSSLCPAAGNYYKLEDDLPIVFMNACDDSKELNRIGHKIVVCQEEDKINSLNHQVGNVSESELVAGGVFITNVNKSTALEFLLKTQFPATFLTNSEDGEIIKDYIKTDSSPKASLEFNITLS